MLRRVLNTHHWTQDMDRSVSFYRDALGLQLRLREGEDWAEFDVGGTTLALHGMYAGHAPPQAGATVVFEVDDLDAAMRLLGSKGVRFGDVAQAPTGRFASFWDPDGNMMQLFEGARGTGS